MTFDLKVISGNLDFENLALMWGILCFLLNYRLQCNVGLMKTKFPSDEANFIKVKRLGVRKTRKKSEGRKREREREGGIQRVRERETDRGRLRERETG